MKKLLIAGAAGAALVYVAKHADEYLNKAGSDGKKPLGDDVAKYGAYAGGAVAAALLAHFMPSAI